MDIDLKLTVNEVNALLGVLGELPTKTGYAPIVINTTNNKLYFYSGGAWRDAGP